MTPALIVSRERCRIVATVVLHERECRGQRPAWGRSCRCHVCSRSRARDAKRRRGGARVATGRLQYYAVVVLQRKTRVLDWTKLAGRSRNSP